MENKRHQIYQANLTRIHNKVQPSHKVLKQTIARVPKQLLKQVLKALLVATYMWVKYTEPIDRFWPSHFPWLFILDHVSKINGIV